MRCGWKRKKPNGEKTRRPVIGTARRTGPALPSGLALLSSFKAQGEPAKRPTGAASRRSDATMAMSGSAQPEKEAVPRGTAPVVGRGQGGRSDPSLPVLGCPLRHGDDDLDWRPVQRSGATRPANNNSDRAAPEQSGAASVNARRCGRRRTHRERSTTRRSC